MIDIKKTYDLYEKQIKKNPKVMLGINGLLSCESIIQYSILQFICRNNINGTSMNTLLRVGIDEELADIILTECIRNGLIEMKDTKYFITENGKSALIASYFRALELIP